MISRGSPYVFSSGTDQHTHVRKATGGWGKYHLRAPEVTMLTLTQGCEEYLFPSARVGKTSKYMGHSVEYSEEYCLTLGVEKALG